MSELVEFELFKLLPKEVRRIVWREALEERLVAVAPRVDWLARRSRLPAMSAVHRESRKIFLGIYIRLIRESTGMPHNTSSFDWLVKDHVYLNPDVDTLILGTIVDRLGGFRFALASPQWREKVGGLGDLITSPTFPSYIEKRLRKVRLHDTCFLQRIFNRRLDRGENLFSYSPFTLCPSAGPIPLPSLQFPCLEVIHLVSLLCIPIPRSTPQGPTGLSLRGMGVYFRYILPTNRLYCYHESTLRSEYLGGIRPNDRIPDDYFKVDPNDSCGIRIDILRDSNLDWVTDA
ncbi:uncharacterized protein BDZ83DRAFT_575236 [Colletotrichum acutatum]|uniref:2EXR domain-containing protein n=1 Tax=Glomerella acutata TaxID=27357 RepID=A0AAD8UKR2_GLOAC|nr:uncharacterized protein BDZ83DRAFT_575236 [Colletotrichum acutatum]KAK1726092.1 hypothetical protein BDZ83DRAFT_575236 [Colletotrichum acutatum]